ncbi:MAG: BMP family ABC transporter substrate-binding protein [Bacteroidales bacterium]|nr:BMP family ABC transporter substrate-binding protein [Bacteroidales bacterium]
MKRTLLIMVAVMMMLALLVGCKAGDTSDAPDATDAPNATDAGDATDDGDATDAGEAAKPGEGMKVALVTDVAGNNPFILAMANAVRDLADRYGYEPVVVECIDNTGFEDNMRALLVEDVDLLIGGGWKAGEPINKISLESPDATAYSLIDSMVESEHVKCISYREQEGCYLLGQMMALAADDDENVFGRVGVSQSASAWKWAWGMIEGIKSIKPDATFIHNFTESYVDSVKAKEFALQQHSQGTKSIAGHCAGGMYGVFEAALEKEFYTSGVDTDVTTPDNPYIMTSVIKDTYNSTAYVIDAFFSGWDTENEVLGLAEGGIGLVHVTHEGNGPLHPNLTEEDIEQLRETAEQIADGTHEIDFTNVPEQDW